MSENITLALQALRDFQVNDKQEGREIAAVQLITSLLNDLEGYGAYNVIASVLTQFTAAQSHPWLSLSYVIQGVLNGWQSVFQKGLETEALEATKH